MGCLTVDGEGDLRLAHPDARHDGLAHVLARVRLAHGLQEQQLVVAKHLAGGTVPTTTTQNTTAQER